MIPIERQVAGKANWIFHGDRKQSNTKAGNIMHSHFSAGGPPNRMAEHQIIDFANEASKSKERIPFKYWVILMQRARKEVNEDKVR